MLRAALAEYLLGESFLLHISTCTNLVPLLLALETRVEMQNVIDAMVSLGEAKVCVQILRFHT